MGGHKANHKAQAMKYILTSRATGREHTVNQAAFDLLSQKQGFKRKYDVTPIEERKVNKPIELNMPIEDKRKKRVEEPKTEIND